jgi:hypothetical protein
MSGYAGAVNHEPYGGKPDDDDGGDGGVPVHERAMRAPDRCSECHCLGPKILRFTH